MCPSLPQAPNKVRFFYNHVLFKVSSGIYCILQLKFLHNMVGNFVVLLVKT